MPAFQSCFQKAETYVLLLCLEFYNFCGKICESFRCFRSGRQLKLISISIPFWILLEPAVAWLVKYQKVCVLLSFSLPP